MSDTNSAHQVVKNGLVSLEKTPDHLVEVTRQNSTTRLLSLPAEIRKLVWNFAVGGNYVSIVFHAIQGSATGSLSAGGPDFQPCPSLASTFRFPEVCRQIYFEAGLLTYSQNVFVADNQYWYYCEWPGLVPAAKREAITSVGLHFFLEEYLLERRKYPNKSLRKFFPNLKSIEIINDIYWIVHWPDQYPDTENVRTQKEWREWVVRKLKEKEGDDIEIKLREEVGFNEWETFTLLAPETEATEENEELEQDG